MELYKHQKDALKMTEGFNRCAYYLDMGLGKTFVGSEKMKRLGAIVNLVVCQKSKVADWIKHFRTYYPKYVVIDLTLINGFVVMNYTIHNKDFVVGVINYELLFRRPELLRLKNFTLMLDESSMIQNDTAKRTKMVFKLKYNNIILLSGTPCGGKYERLLSQCKLLGWDITKNEYYNRYINYHEQLFGGNYPVKIIDGYKNIDDLKDNLRKLGAVFMKTDEVFDLPAQIDSCISVSATKAYKVFLKNRLLIDKNLGIEFVGDTPLKRLLYARQLCGAYNPHKLKAFADLLQSTDDRLIVFYNFNSELNKLLEICKDNDRPVSVVNGNNKDLEAFENAENSVTLIQYQAGAMGLNLQKANKIVYFTPPLSSELFEQSKKRTHRLGQEKPCFYYYLVCKGSIEEHIYNTLKLRQNYTEKLFEKEFEHEDRST